MQKETIEAILNNQPFMLVLSCVIVFFITIGIEILCDKFDEYIEKRNKE